jgi:hypothetical protein
MELEKPISEGYEEAYDSCVEYLTKKVESEVNADEE